VGQSRPRAEVLRGRAQRLAGQLEEAERTFTTLIERLQATAQPAMVAWACHLLAQVQQGRGNLNGAEESYRRAHAISLKSEGAAPLPGAIAYLGLAEVAYHRGELVDALNHVTAAIPLCHQAANATLVAAGLTTLAWIRQWEGDPAGAREAMTQAMEIGLGAGVADLINPIPARRARLLLVQGDVEAAAAWTVERGLGAGDDPDYAWEPAYLTLTRVLLAQGRAGEAAGLLKRLNARATKQARSGSLIEIEVLQALALGEMDDQAGALSALATALRRAQPHGYVRIFADEGEPMRSLLETTLASASAVRANGEVSAEYVGRLIAVIEADAGRRPLPFRNRAKIVVPGLVEALSQRELEVLKLLAAGKANREIADELYVTLHTVKKHITHILGKLGAANRTEAAARARDVGLLP
jgi:LuxR family maltose regulon positive regulatory protein